MLNYKGIYYEGLGTPLALCDKVYLAGAKSLTFFGGG